MKFSDIFKNTIELTDERWVHITKEHPEVSDYKDRIHEILGSPDYVKKSSRDGDVRLFYKWYQDIFGGKFFLAVVKSGLRSFILTCYITDMIKKGVAVWEKK
jgi:hypothetical protein